MVLKRELFRLHVTRRRAARRLGLLDPPDVVGGVRGVCVGGGNAGAPAADARRVARSVFKKPPRRRGEEVLLGRALERLAFRAIEDERDSCQKEDRNDENGAQFTYAFRAGGATAFNDFKPVLPGAVASALYDRRVGKFYSAGGRRKPRAARDVSRAGLV